MKRANSIAERIVARRRADLFDEDLTPGWPSGDSSDAEAAEDVEDPLPEEEDEEDLPDEPDNGLDQDGIAEVDEKLSYIAGLVEEAKQHLDNCAVHELMTSHIEAESAAEAARKSAQEAARVISELSEEIQRADEAIQDLLEQHGSDDADDDDPGADALGNPIAARIASRHLHRTAASWEDIADEGQKKRLQDVAASFAAAQKALGDAGKALGKAISDRDKAIKAEDPAALEDAMKAVLAAAEPIRGARVQDLADSVERIAKETMDRDKDIIGRMDKKSRRF